MRSNSSRVTTTWAWTAGLVPIPPVTMMVRAASSRFVLLTDSRVPLMSAMTVGVSVMVMEFGPCAR